MQKENQIIAEIKKRFQSSNSKTRTVMMEIKSLCKFNTVCKEFNACAYNLQLYDKSDFKSN
jgi:hypothetical protein